jgi:hypothetical protein
MKDKNHIFSNEWIPITSDLMPTKTLEDILMLETAYRNTPKTINDFANLIVEDEVKVVSSEDTSTLGIIGSHGLGLWS